MTDEAKVSTKERPGEYDAIASAKPDEPLFTIQGGDPIGPATVMFWADQARLEARKISSRRKAEKLLRKAMDAELVAWAMKDYQSGPQESVGDGRVSYSGVTVNSDKARTARAAQIAAVGRLHNLISNGVEIVASLEAVRVNKEERAIITAALEQIRQAALTIEPRRGKEST